MENYFEPNLTDDQLRAISSIGLAHMGDAVFEVLVRTWLCAQGHHCPGAGGEPGGEGGADPAPFDGGGGRCVPPRAERSREVGTRPCHPGPVRRGHGPGGPVGLAVSEGPAGPDQCAFPRDDGGVRPCHWMESVCRRWRRSCDRSCWACGSIRSSSPPGTR